MRRAYKPALITATTLCLMLFGSSAFAERSQQGNLIVALNGGITPRILPRGRPAPVVVHLSGQALTADSSPLPRVNWIRLELAWRGVIDTKGLPVCPRIRLVGRISRQALEGCGHALVGRGALFAQVFIPNQKPFGVHARLLAFNGRTTAGRPAVLVHAFSPSPPVAFVIPFSVHHKKGSFRTVLITTIRRSVGPWPHVANFQVAVSRRFMYQGKEHSYVSASCPIPKNFTAGFLSFARATYTFEGGRQVATESVRSCRAR
jgi:hypothetical protein